MLRKKSGNIQELKDEEISLDTAPSLENDDMVEVIFEGQEIKAAAAEAVPMFAPNFQGIDREVTAESSEKEIKKVIAQYRSFIDKYKRYSYSTVQVAESRFLTDEMLMELLQNSHGTLKQLKIRQCEKITGRFDKLRMKVKKNAIFSKNIVSNLYFNALEKIEFDSCVNLKSLLMDTRNLKELTIDQCGNIRHLLIDAPLLSNLQISCCAKMHIIVTKSKHLSTISITGCASITEQTLSTISYAPEMITNVDLSRCFKVSHHQLRMQYPMFITFDLSNFTDQFVLILQQTIADNLARLGLTIQTLDIVKATHLIENLRYYLARLNSCSTKLSLNEICEHLQMAPLGLDNRDESASYLHYHHTNVVNLGRIFKSKNKQVFDALIPPPQETFKTAAEQKHALRRLVSAIDYSIGDDELVKELIGYLLLQYGHVHSHIVNRQQIIATIIEMTYHFSTKFNKIAISQQYLISNTFLEHLNSFISEQTILDSFLLEGEQWSQFEVDRVLSICINIANLSSEMRSYVIQNLMSFIVDRLCKGKLSNQLNDLITLIITDSRYVSNFQTMVFEKIMSVVSASLIDTNALQGVLIALKNKRGISDIQYNNIIAALIKLLSGYTKSNAENTVNENAITDFLLGQEKEHEANSEAIFEVVLSSKKYSKKGQYLDKEILQFAMHSDKLRERIFNQFILPTLKADLAHGKAILEMLIALKTPLPKKYYEPLMALLVVANHSHLALLDIIPALVSVFADRKDQLIGFYLQHYAALSPSDLLSYQNKYAMDHLVTFAEISNAHRHQLIDIVLAKLKSDTFFCYNNLKSTLSLQIVEMKRFKQLIELAKLSPEHTNTIMEYLKPIMGTQFSVNHEDGRSLLAIIAFDMLHQNPGEVEKYLQLCFKLLSNNRTVEWNELENVWSRCHGHQNSNNDLADVIIRQLLQLLNSSNYYRDHIIQQLIIKLQNQYIEHTVTRSSFPCRYNRVVLKCLNTIATQSENNRQTIVNFMKPEFNNDRLSLVLLKLLILIDDGLVIYQNDIYQFLLRCKDILNTQFKLSHHMPLDYAELATLGTMMLRHRLFDENFRHHLFDDREVALEGMHVEQFGKCFNYNFYLFLTPFISLNQQLFSHCFHHLGQRRAFESRPENVVAVAQVPSIKSPGYFAKHLTFHRQRKIKPTRKFKIVRKSNDDDCSVADNTFEMDVLSVNTIGKK